MDPLTQPQAPVQAPDPTQQAQADPNTPLDDKGIKAIQTAIQGAVDSVLSLLKPGSVTHDQVLQKIADAVTSLSASQPLSGLSAGPGLDLESLQEDTGETGTEPAA